MVHKLARKPYRTLLGLGLLLAWLAGSLPAGATKPLMPPRQKVTAVNQEGLEAAARKYLSPQEVELLRQSITKQSPGSYATKEFEPPLIQLRHGQFIPDLVDMVKSCLARGDSAKVKKFFQVVNQQKLIRGAGTVVPTAGNFQDPMVIQLELRQSPQKEFQVEVWYRLVHPRTINGKKREGAGRTYPTGITGP